VDHAEIEDTLMDLDHRVNTIEQILPTLLTRNEFQNAMEKGATKKDLEALRSEMATKKDLEALRSGTKADIEALRSEVQLGFVNFSSEIRRHFDVVAESLRGDIRLLADGYSYLGARLDAIERRLPHSR